MDVAGVQTPTRQMLPHRPSLPAHTFRPHSTWDRVAIFATVAMAAMLNGLPAGAASSATPAAGGAADTWRLWRCELSYMPARSTWVRRVALRADTRRVLQVRIDGQDTHSFAVRDTLVLTSMDGEHIAFDVGSGLWESDFRSAAQGRGRCEPED